MHFDLHTILLAVAAAATIGLSKGGLQIASMFAVPILAMAMPPITAAATLLPVLIASDMVSVIAYRKYADRRLLVILLPSMLIGVAVGWASAEWIPVAMIMFVIGAVGVGYCLRSFVGHSAERVASSRSGAFWGMVSGFTSFISHSGGAPYQIFMASQRIEKLAYAGTTAVAFATVNVVKIVPYWRLGAFESGIWMLSVCLLPVGAAFTLVGVYLLKVVSETTFRRILNVALLVISLKLILDSLSEGS